MWQTGVHGVLTFRAFEPAAFGEHEIELAWQVTNQIAGANQFARLEQESAERDRSGSPRIREGSPRSYRT